MISFDGLAIFSGLENICILKEPIDPDQPFLPFTTVFMGKPYEKDTVYPSRILSKRSRKRLNSGRNRQLVKPGNIRHLLKPNQLMFDFHDKRIVWNELSLEWIVNSKDLWFKINGKIPVINLRIDYRTTSKEIINSKLTEYCEGYFMYEDTYMGIRLTFERQSDMMMARLLYADNVFHNNYERDSIFCSIA